MEKEFVPYLEALELKELGFDEPCLSYYEGESFSHHLATIEVNDEYITLAPTFSQAFRWFRSNGIESTIVPIILGTHKEYQFVIFALNEVLNTGFENYEKAELECLKKMIKIVKNEKKW